MGLLDPFRLFGRLRDDLPQDLHGNVFVTGSLAAAYAYAVQRWHTSLIESFPASWRQHAGGAGQGLRELLAHDELMEEALKTTAVGLLSGSNVGVEALIGIGEQLIADAIEPLEATARQTGE